MEDSIAAAVRILFQTDSYICTQACEADVRNNISYEESWCHRLELVLHHSVSIEYMLLTCVYMNLHI